MSPPGADRNPFSWGHNTKAEVHVLLRQLNTHSSPGRGTDPVLSSEVDIEKGPPNNSGPFNIRDYLTSSNEAKRAVGIQPKRVGVAWENLQVVVPGSKDHKVRLSLGSSNVVI
jgi:hypothetical protein